MNANRVGSPFSFARFAHAQHICRECQTFGSLQYKAEYVRLYGIDRFLPGPVPPCDVCDKRLLYVEAVTVALPLYEETPQARGQRIERIEP